MDLNYSEGILDSKCSLINPEMEIPIASMAVHHITNEMVKEAPKMEDVWPSFQEGEFQAMAAHNAQFDFSFLKTEMPTLCTFRLARHLWPELESHKNQHLRYYLKVDVDSDMPMHRALGDATVSALALQKMLKIAIEEKEVNELEGLIKWIQEPVLLNTCWFGKHRGQKWAGVPIDYLQWMKKNNVQMDDVDIAHTVNHYLEQLRI